MTTYIVRRLLLIVPVVLIVTLILFVTLRVLPGDPVAALYGDTGFDEEQLAATRAELGLDRPLPQQYVSWLTSMLRGDFGESLVTRQPSLQQFWDRVPVTLELAALAMVIALVIALPVGCLSALRQDSLADYAMRLAAMLALAVPGFWLATLIITFPAIWWGWSPPLGSYSLLTDPLANLKQFLPAAMALGATLAGSVMRFTRAMMLEVLRQDYVRTARAKGLRDRLVVRRHVVKNAMIPVVTVIGIDFARLLGGTVVIEQVFSLSGIGSLTFEAISRRDFAQIQTNIFILAVVLVLANLVVDLAYAWLNPRIRYS